MIRTRRDLAPSSFFLGRHFEKRPPNGFTRRPLAANAIFYSANSGARRLIVCFAGGVHRVMLPISGMLQFLDEDLADVLLLFDPELRQYNSGVPGYAESAVALTRRIAELAEAGRYDSVITYGTSMGGLPALRIGRLLGASRAVSINGRFPWPVQRLAGGAQVNPFDALCACVRSSTRCVALYSGLVRGDVASVQQLSYILPSCRRIETPFADHNLVFEIYKAGCIRPFYKILFGGPEPDQKSIDGLIAVARHRRNVASARPARAGQNLVSGGGPRDRIFGKALNFCRHLFRRGLDLHEHRRDVHHRDAERQPRQR